MKTRVTYGIVGAGPDSFIGGVHRIGAAYDLRASLVAGCFSRNAEKNQTAGNAFGVSEDRIYATFEEMAEKEAAWEEL